MGQPHDLGDRIGWIVGLHVEMRAGLRASSLDVASLDGPCQEEIQFGATGRRIDLHLANVRVP